MSQEKNARFQNRVSVPVGKDSSISFGKMRDALPADHDCLIYIPLDASGRKITWSGEMAKSAADYVFIAMSKNGVFSLTIPNAEVFKSQIKGQSRFMVLSNNLLACSGTTYSGNGKFEVSGNLLRFPSGEKMMLPWLTHPVTRKPPSGRTVEHTKALRLDDTRAVLRKVVVSEDTTRQIDSLHWGGGTYSVKFFGTMNQPIGHTEGEALRDLLESPAMAGKFETFPSAVIPRANSTFPGFDLETYLKDVGVKMWKRPRSNAQIRK